MNRDPHTLQIGELLVWLAGDANGRVPLLHEAADDGHIAGRNAMADSPRAYCRRTPLSIVFTSPGMAVAGARFADLDAGRSAIGSTDFSKQGRARIAERAAGVLRV